MYTQLFCVNLASYCRHSNVVILTTSNVTEKIDLAFVDRADIKQYIGPPSVNGIYSIYLSCLEELMKVTRNNIPTLSFSPLFLIHCHHNVKQICFNKSVTSTFKLWILFCGLVSSLWQIVSFFQYRDTKRSDGPEDEGLAVWFLASPVHKSKCNWARHLTLHFSWWLFGWFLANKTKQKLLRIQKRLLCTPDVFMMPLALSHSYLLYASLLS